MILKRLLYFHFRRLYELRNRFEKRVTGGGLLVLGGLVVSAALGIDTNRTMAYQIFTFLLSLFLVSVIGSLFFRAPPLTVRRILPRFGMAGKPLMYHLVIQNHSTREQKGLYVQEELDNPCPSLDEFLRIPEPFESARNWFDRSMGYYRWQWLVSKKQRALTPEQALPVLPPQSSAEVQLEMMPLSRGYLHLTGITLSRPDPFGLLRSPVVLPSSQSVLILPKRYALPPIKLGGSRKFQRGGVTLASKVGDSEELLSLRNYRSGDPLRRIHWRTSARIGKPVLMEYQEEFFVRHALILDTFLQSEYADVFEEAVSVAASFVSAVGTEDSLLDFIFVGTQGYCFTSGRGGVCEGRMMEILASVKACRDKPFSALHHLIMGRMASLSSCICILVVWDEERQNLIRDLKSFGIPVLVLLIREANSPVPDLGPMKDCPSSFHSLEVGKIEEGLARL